MMRKNVEVTLISTASAFLIGGLIGAGVALLMAPKSGEETRTLIRDKSLELKDRATGAVDNAGQALTDLKDTAKERAVEIKDRSQEMLSRQKTALEDGVESIKQSV